MKFLVYFSLFFLIFTSKFIPVNADDMSSYPIEFSDFFKKRTGNVSLVVAGEQRDVSVISFFNYDNIKISSNFEDQKAIKLYLANYIADKGVDQIIKELTAGVAANPGCTEAISDCVPHVLSDEIKYSFDFDTNTLKVFVGTSLVTKSNDKEYLPTLRRNNGLVNNSTLYAQYNNETDIRFNFANKTTLGLPVGFIELDTQSRNSGDDFDVYSAVFDTEFADKRVVMGYLDKTGRSFNSTDILNNNADYSAFNVQFGSSHNLLKGGSKGAQKLFFIAPQDAQLEVYLANRLLISKSVSSGRQSISYADLPQGAYTVNLKLSAGGVLIVDEMIQVVNNNKFILAVDDLDYAFNVGVFDSNMYGYSHDTFSGNDLARTYLQAKSAWRITESEILYGGITANNGEYYTQFGIRYIYDNLFSADYFFGYFSAGESYQSVNVNFGRLSFTFNALDIDDDVQKFSLSNQLYGMNSYTNFSINYSQAMLGGNGYVNYNYYNNSESYWAGNVNSSNGINSNGVDNGVVNVNSINAINSVNVLSQSSDRKFRHDSFNMGWSSNIYNGTLTLNSSYNSTGTYNDVKFGVYWSQRFGRNVSGGLSILANDKGLSKYNNSLSANVSDDNWSLNHTAMVGILENGNTDNSISGSYYWQNDMTKANSYTYVNNKGLLVSSGTLQNTQVITPSSLSLTNLNGNAFADINLQSDVPISKIRYNLYSDLYSKSGYMSDNSNTVLAINSYDKILFSLDESNSIEIESQKESQYVYPGTVLQIKNVISSLDSLIFVVSDILGKPVTQIRCSGDGCRGVESLSSDGVFRVNFQKGSAFTLTSERRQCVFDKDNQKSSYINAICLQGLYQDDVDYVSHPNSVDINQGDIEGFAYIGNSYSKDVIFDLEQVGLPFRSIHVGKKQYIYVKHSELYSQVQLDVLDSIDAKLISNNIDIQSLFTGIKSYE